MLRHSLYLVFGSWESVAAYIVLQENADDKIWANGAQKEIFKDLNNYGLCARTHHSLGRHAFLAFFPKNWLVFLAFTCSRNVLIGSDVRRNTAWNAIVEVPNVENARALFHHAEQEQHSTETDPTGSTAPAPSEHIIATLTASSSADEPAKLSLHPATASSSSTAVSESPAERSSTGATSSVSHGEASKARTAFNGSGIQRQLHAGGKGRPPAELCPSGPPVRGRTWLKHQVAGHDMLASLAWNEEYLDSAAAYCTVPLSSSLDVASQDRQDGIQYRVGVHHVSFWSSEFFPFSQTQILT